MDTPSFLNTLNAISEKHTEKDAFCINGKTFSYNEFYQKVIGYKKGVVLKKELLEYDLGGN